MKASIRYFANNKQNICDDPEIYSILKKDFCSPWLPWGKEKSQQYMRAFNKGSGCWVYLDFSVSIKEMNAYEYFMLYPKHIFSNDTDKVFYTNRDFANVVPIHHATSFGHFRIRDKVFINKIKPYEDRIWSMEFCEAYIAANNIIDEMLKKFTGIKRADVVHYRTKELVEGWSSFYSEHWLDKLVQDESTYLRKTDDGYDYVDTHCGLYSAYRDDLQYMPDVFRMPQSYNDFGDSAYFVRKPVMEYWFSQGIEKSFYLKPLLVLETKEYEEYVSLWREIKTALSVNPGNRIGL